jgi:hypothetical protein
MSLIDIEKAEIQGKKFPKVFLGTAFGLTIASFGLAIGAFITLNNSETSKAELGNGLVATPSCDNTGIVVTPYQSFINRTSSKFTFNEITLTDISKNCAGKDFIIVVRDGDGNKLPISVSDNGTLIETVRIYFNQYAGANGTVDRNGTLTDMFKLVGGDSTTVSITAISGLESTGVALPEDANGDVNWNGDNPKTYWQLRSDSNGVSIVFNPSPTSRNDSILGFADARDVYRVTLESTDHSDQ